MDRGTAMEHIQRHGAKDGQFLVRTSTHKPGVYVLSMAAGGSVYNFEILKKVNNLQRFKHLKIDIKSQSVLGEVNRGQIWVL